MENIPLFILYCKFSFSCSLSMQEALTNPNYVFSLREIYDFLKKRFGHRQYRAVLMFSLTGTYNAQIKMN